MYVVMQSIGKHLEISSNSYHQRLTHMQMHVPCCHTSLVHFKWMSISSNESNMCAHNLTLHKIVSVNVIRVKTLKMHFHRLAQTSF